MNTARRRLLIVGLAGMILLVAGALLILATRSSPPPPLPNPNGYDDLLRSAQSVNGRPIDYVDLSHDDLRVLISTNADALRLLRLGLSRRCAVPTESALLNSVTGVTSDLVALKALALLVCAEGRLAQMEERSGDAAQSYLDAIRLGTAISHGGVIMTRLVGIACEGVGCTRLVKLMPQLTCDQMRLLAADLKKVDTNTVAWSEVVRNENRWVRAQLKGYLNPIRLVTDWWQARNIRTVAQVRHDTAIAQLRLVMAELALRAYRCEHGHAAQSLAALVPKYLEQVPPDPFSRYPLVYRQNGTNWVLYSIGPDHVDDGGKRINRAVSGDFIFGASSSGNQIRGDLFYDSQW